MMGKFTETLPSTMQQHIMAVNKKAVLLTTTALNWHSSLLAMAPSYQTTLPSHFGSDHFESACYISLHLAAKLGATKKRQLIIIGKQFLSTKMHFLG